MQKLCPFYKFQRDFANKVEIHICKFSQQLDHISHGKLIFFFFDISIIFFYFFKLKRRSRGVHPVEFFGQVSNGAPWEWCAITSFEKKLKKLLVVAHRGCGAPLLVLKKKMLVVAHRKCGAPLVYCSGAPHVWCAISVHIIYSPFPSCG